MNIEYTPPPSSPYSAIWFRMEVVSTYTSVVVTASDLSSSLTAVDEDSGKMNPPPRPPLPPPFAFPAVWFPFFSGVHLHFGDSHQT